MAAADSSDKTQGIEYSIYTFDTPKGDKGGNGRWQKSDTVTEMAAAMGKAENMFASGQYQKVEVKQKYFDKKKNRHIDMTLKTFEGGGKKEINLAVILFFAVLCGAAAFGVTYYMNQ